MALGFPELMRIAQHVDPTSVSETLQSLATALGGTDLVVYLIDFEQSALIPVPDHGTHSDAPLVEDVTSSRAGQAFIEQRAVAAAVHGGFRFWAPLVEGSDRTGVLALTMPEESDAALRNCEGLAQFAGYLIATLARSTDLYNLYRRRRSMTLAASIQWDLLPPLTLSSRPLTTAGALEPAYDVGGDSFDYALNENVFEMAIVDAAGHGISAALISVLAIGSYRHDRREGQRIDRIHTNLDEAIATHHPARAFATGQLARLELTTGTLSWTNAGHPLPLLVRDGRVERELTCRPTLPWGMGHIASETQVSIANEELVPGDQVLFYTDGIVEARNSEGEFFGVDRLFDQIGRYSADHLRPEEVVRRIVKAVIDHNVDPLADDATLVLCQWSGPTQP